MRAGGLGAEAGWLAACLAELLSTEAQAWRGQRWDRLRSVLPLPNAPGDSGVSWAAPAVRLCCREAGEAFSPWEVGSPRAEPEAF